MFQAKICHFSSVLHKPECVCGGWWPPSHQRWRPRQIPLRVWLGTWVWFGGSAFLAPHQRCRIPWDKRDQSQAAGTELPTPPWRGVGTTGIEETSGTPKTRKQNKNTTVAGAVSSAEVRVGTPF